MSDATAQRLWSTALGQLQLVVTKPNYDTWLKDTVGLRLDEDTLVVGVSTEFTKEWLNARLRSLAEQTVSGIAGRAINISFGIAPNGDSCADKARTPALPLPGASPASPNPVAQAPQKLHPKYTFSSFVVGPSNRLAAAAALAAAERPGQDYNPLFIYSAPGLGKTHLLQAITHRALSLDLRCLYVTSEQFTNEFVTALATGQGAEFRRRYRSLQLLVVDDLQFLVGKERTQEEFFHTFNALHADGCQLVLANDRPPTAMPDLERRLCSRFGWGLIADIQPPDLEHRLAILQAKAAAQGTTLPPTVALLLAEHAPASIRELEGSLNRVLAYASLVGATTITPDTVASALAALSHRPSSPPDPSTILSVVASYFNLPRQALTTAARTKAVADARHIAMYLLRSDAHLPLKQIGALLGNRDHSTVLHGVHKIANSLLNHPRLASQLAEIRSLMARHHRPA